MKRTPCISFLVLFLASLMIAVNRLAVPLPDWTVRIVGVVLLLALLRIVYSVVRNNMEQ